METNVLLYISLIIYFLVIGFGVIFKIKWLYMIAGLLWFIPLLEIENNFIKIVSVVMMLVHFMLGFKNDNEDF